MKAMAMVGVWVGRKKERKTAQTLEPSSDEKNEPKNQEVIMIEQVCETRIPRKTQV